MKLMTRDHSHLGSYLKLAPAKFETFAAKMFFREVFVLLLDFVDFTDERSE